MATFGLARGVVDRLIRDPRRRVLTTAATTQHPGPFFRPLAFWDHLRLGHPWEGWGLVLTCLYPQRCQIGDWKEGDQLGHHDGEKLGRGAPP